MCLSAPPWAGGLLLLLARLARGRQVLGVPRMRERLWRTYARAINSPRENVSTMTVAPVGGAGREQTRARYPDEDGYIESDGVRVFYEVYGAGEPTVLLFPTWEIVHSRAWKCQVPYFARLGRVVTFDRRGNGRSSRPREVRA